MAARSEKAARGRMRTRARGKREKGVRVCNLPASSQHWSRREERLRRTRRRCAGRAEAASGGHHGDMASMKSSTMTTTRFGSAQEFVQLNTGPTVGASLHNITGDVQALLNAHSFRGGSVTVTSMHTTLAISINENERWLVQADIRRWLREHVARPDEMYLHNDIEVRRLDEPDMPDDEPKNAHAHLQAMTIGNSESIGVVDGKLVLGTYQSILICEMDGPRDRKVSVTMVGEFGCDKGDAS